MSLCNPLQCRNVEHVFAYLILWIMDILTELSRMDRFLNRFELSNTDFN